MSKFPVKELVKDDGQVLYVCAACDRRCKPPKVKQRGRPKSTEEKYLLKITDDDRTHEARYCSLYQAVDDLKQRGFTITRHQVMYALSGKWDYPNLLVQKL